MEVEGQDMGFTKLETSRDMRFVSRLEANERLRVCALRVSRLMIPMSCLNHIPRPKRLITDFGNLKELILIVGSRQLHEEHCDEHSMGDLELIASPDE
jgi:hypothetical protein